MMQPTYFASFLLGKKGESNSPKIEQIVPHIDKWIFSNRNRKVRRPDDIEFLTEKVNKIDDKSNVQTRILFLEKERYSAIRYEHGDNSNRLWRTDIVLHENYSNGYEIRCSVGVHIANQGSAIIPLGDVASRPAIVPKLISSFGAYEAYSLPAKPVNLDESNIDLFSRLLNSQDRHIPIILITPLNINGSYMVDLTKIADKLAGIAYVIFAKTPDTTYGLKEAIGKNMSVYNGAARIYWPKFKLSDSPYRHTLWLAEEIREIETDRGGFAQYLLRNLAKISATRSVPSAARWEDVYRKKLQLIAGAANGEQELRELLEIALEEGYTQKEKADMFGSQIENMKIELNEAKSQIQVKLNESEQWKKSYFEALKSKGIDADIEEKEFTDIRDVISFIEEGYDDKILFIPSALRKEAILFTKIDMIYKALSWLCTTYVNSKLGKISCPDLDFSCRTACGMFYRPHQSKNTMKKYEDDYKVTRHGKTHWMQEHIGVGSGTDPRNNARIAFYFDETENKLIVGFIGQHQETSASN